jgi:hypothetical protein
VSPGAPSLGPDGVVLTRSEEIGYAQQIYRDERRRAPTPPLIIVPAEQILGAGADQPDAAPPLAAPRGGGVAAPIGERAATRAPTPAHVVSLLAALAGLVGVGLFFLPAFRGSVGDNSEAQGANLLRPDLTFYLSVDAKPSPSTVRIDGRTVGTTPVLANAPCPPIGQVVVVVEHEGYEALREEVSCAGGGSKKVAARLQRQRRGK